VLATVVVIALIGFSRRTSGPALEVPIPKDLDSLDAQLRLYIVEKVKWVRQAPRDAGRHATLGMVYAANSIWPEARLAFRNAATLDPKEPLAQLYVAVATQETGDFDGALKLYREVTVRFPDFAPAFYRLGDALLRAGTVDEAENVFRRLLALAPQEGRGFAGLATSSCGREITRKQPASSKGPFKLIPARKRRITCWALLTAVWDGRRTPRESSVPGLTPSNIRCPTPGQRPRRNT